MEVMDGKNTFLRIISGILSLASLVYLTTIYVSIISESLEFDQDPTPYFGPLVLSTFLLTLFVSLFAYFSYSDKSKSFSIALWTGVVLCIVFEILWYVSCSIAPESCLDICLPCTWGYIIFLPAGIIFTLFNVVIVKNVLHFLEKHL